MCERVKRGRDWVSPQSINTSTMVHVCLHQTMCMHDAYLSEGGGVRGERGGGGV